MPVAAAAEHLGRLQEVAEIGSHAQAARPRQHTDQQMPSRRQRKTSCTLYNSSSYHSAATKETLLVTPGCRVCSHVCRANLSLNSKQPPSVLRAWVSLHESSVEMDDPQSITYFSH